MVRSIRIADHDRTWRVASELRQRSLDQIRCRLAVEGRTARDWYVTDQSVQIEAAARERRVEMGPGAQGGDGRGDGSSGGVR